MKDTFAGIWAKIRPTPEQLESLQSVAPEIKTNDPTVDAVRQDTMDRWHKPTEKDYHNTACVMRERLLNMAKARVSSVVLFHIPLYVFPDEIWVIPTAGFFAQELANGWHEGPQIALRNTALYKMSPKLFQEILSDYVDTMGEKGAYRLGFLGGGFDSDGCVTSLNVVASWL